MDLRLRNTAIYGFLLVIWLLVVGWQVEEHVRVREAAKTDLRNRAGVYANFLSATIRGQRFRSTLFRERLEPVLKLLVKGGTNELVRPSELIAVTLLNSAGDPVVAVGDTNVIQSAVTEGENWGPKVVTFVSAIPGIRITDGDTTNPVVVVGRGDFTNEMRNFRRPDRPPDDTNAPENLVSSNSVNDAHDGRDNHDDHGGHEPRREGMDGGPPPPPPDLGGEPRPDGRRGGRGRPPWMNAMTEDDLKRLSQRELHGLVLAMSTEKYRAMLVGDIWLRFVIVLLRGHFRGGIRPGVADGGAEFGIANPPGARERDEHAFARNEPRGGGLGA